MCKEAQAQPSCIHISEEYEKCGVLLCLEKESQNPKFDSGLPPQNKKTKTDRHKYSITRNAEKL